MTAPDPGIAAFLALPAVAGREETFGPGPWDAETARRIAAGLRAGPAPERSQVPVHEIRDLEVDGVPVRLYRPSAGPGLPLVVYFHGGGWVFGDLETHDHPCRVMANEAGAVVVSVDYGLAPEHAFPRPVEECAAVTRALVKQAEAFGVDPGRVVLSGGSSGGNLAAAVALREPDLHAAGLLMVYPPLDGTTSLPSYDENAHGYNLSAAEMRYYWSAYAAEADRTDPLLSPLHAPDLSGLPPTLVMTAEFDVLRDDGEEFGRRLAAAGVPVDVRRYAGQIHGFLGLRALSPAADHALFEIGRWLRDRFA
ncbi:alpha/beta hydrolase [Pseudonocardia pini]|uniref:alpha/beta hydrolase n=1 Tax=Pseudonocardia pini TaxID=2758030 RepID=UPI0015F039E8|nr:alpha/beta hydrolase [Pseudonocardia pini]